MRKFIQHRDRGNIAGVARGRLKGANAALTQNDVRVAVRHNVFGGHEQLFDGGTEAAFEHNRLARLAKGFEQGKVLHVASADLKNVGVFSHHVHVAVAHHLGDDAKAGFLLGLPQ